MLLHKPGLIDFLWQQPQKINYHYGIFLILVLEYQLGEGILYPPILG